MKRILIGTLVCLGVLASNVFAAADSPDNRASKKAVRQVAAKYAAAFNQGDAKALTALWTPQGDHVGPRGERLKGRKAIREKFEEFFSLNQQTRLSLTIDGIRFIKDDVAILDGTVDVSPPLQGAPVEAHATVVLVKQGEQWLIESSRDSLTAIPSNYEHLRELEWMIGDWDEAATAKNASVESSCDWTVNKNFIIRKFTAEIEGLAPRAGTQVISWNPRKDRICSWVFDSSGGFSEATWTRKDDRWTIRSSGVLRDGSEVSATNIVTKIDNDTFTFESRKRILDGQNQPDIEPVQIIRRLPQTAPTGKPAEQKQPARETILPP